MTSQQVKWLEEIKAEVPITEILRQLEDMMQINFRLIKARHYVVIKDDSVKNYQKIDITIGTQTEIIKLIGEW